MRNPKMGKTEYVKQIAEKLGVKITHIKAPPVPVTMLPSSDHLIILDEAEILDAK